MVMGWAVCWRTARCSRGGHVEAMGPDGSLWVYGCAGRAYFAYPGLGYRFSLEDLRCPERRDRARMIEFYGVLPRR